MQQWPTEIRIVHGEEGAKRAMADILEARYAESEKKLELMR
jgi:metallo-beta-lactamase family protein